VDEVCGDEDDSTSTDGVEEVALFSTITVFFSLCSAVVVVSFEGSDVEEIRGEFVSDTGAAGLEAALSTGVVKINQ
jgi:hypothetical protein